jgi:polyadenylate-binding protein
MFDNTQKRSKCFGYLNFYSKEEAERCLNEMNNANCDGKQIVLNKKKDSEFDSEANVLVKNLPKELTQSELFQMFKSFGNIISCKIETNKKDGQSLGFGYIQFANKEQAAAAIEKANNSKVQDKEIQVVLHNKKSDREIKSQNFTNLFVKNIPTDFTEAQLSELFAQFGEITSVKVKGEGSDVGFVMFKEHESAQKAIDAYDRKKEVNGKVIFVCKHISKSENQTNDK